MANIINLFGQDEEDETIKNIRSLTKDVVDKISAEITVKSEIIYTALDFYKEAINAAGVKNGTVIRNSCGKFLSSSLFLTLEGAENGRLFFLKEKFGDDIYVLGIDTTFNSLSKAELVMKNNSKDNNFSINPFVIKITENETLTYTIEDGWINTDRTPDIPCEQEQDLINLVAEISERNDAFTDLVIFATRDQKKDLTMSLCSSLYEENQELIELANKTMGHTAYILYNDTFYLRSLDINHFGYAISFEEGYYCINQYVKLSELFPYFDDEPEDVHQDVHLQFVAKTKTLSTVKKIIHSYEDKRSGMRIALTIPLSLKTSVCIQPNEPERMQEEFIENINKIKKMTAQEEESANCFLAWLGLLIA